MSLQPGSAYVNYLAVKKLLPLDEQANQYPSTTIFAVDSSGALAGYDPATWFSTIGMPNPSTLQAEIVSTIGIIDAGLSSTLYGLVSTSQIVNQYILASSLSSTVAGLAATTGVSQAQLDNRIKNLAAEGYVSSTQLTSTVAGLGTAGYLSTSTDGTLHVKALSTGSVSLSTLALIDIAAPTSKKLLYNNGGGLYFGETLLGGAITDLSLNTLDVSNATVYADLTVGGSITAPITYSETLSTLVVNAQKNPTDRTWAVAGYFPSEGDYGVQFSSNNGITWDLSAHLFSGTVNQIKYLNGIWFGLGKYGILNGTDYKGIYYTINNGLTWIAPSGFVNTNVFDIAYNGSYYVLVSDTGVYTSPNGTSWTLSPSSPITFQCITYNGIYWVAAGSSTIGYSVDGVSWSNASGSFGSPNFKAIAYNGHTLVVANTNSGNIFYSDDKGLSWTAVAVGGTQVPSVTWNGSYFLVGTFSPYGLYYSRDGRSWTQSPTTPSETVTSIFWNGRITYGVGTTNTYQTTDGITWTQSAKTYNVNSPTSISYSVYVGDDIIGGNIRYYGVDIPHYYDSTNQLYAGPDRLLLNNTLTVKDGFVGIMKGDPTVHLDVQGAARASTFAASTLQLADMNGETTLTGNGGMLLINNIPIVQSTVAGLGQTYVSIPSLRSTVEGLGTAGYVSSLSLASTVQGLGTFGYVSSLSLASTVQGLGTYGYVSSQSLASTVAGLGTAGYVSSQSLASTVAGLGTAGYVSSQSLASTVAGLGTAGYVSSQSLASTVAGLGTAGYVSSQSLASTVAGLGTAGYVSSQSLASTVAGLGTAGYISSLSLASTVGSLLTNLQVSSFAASTITFAKLFTSTVYVGNNNLSTNLIRFYGTTDDGNTVGQYGHTVIGERVYNAPSQSELLFFKGNDGFATTDVDRIRHLAGSHQFDIINRSDNTSIWYDGFENPPEPDINAALFINTIGNIGIGTTTPARPLHVRPLNDSGVVRLDRVTGSGPAYHMHYFDASGDTVPYKGFSMHIDDVSGANTGKFIIGDLQQQVAGFNALPRIVVDSSGNVGIGTATPSYNLDVSGRLIIRNGTGRVISSDASGNFSVGSSMSNFGAVMEVVNGTLVPNPAPSVNFPHLSLRGAYDTVGKGQFWVDGGFNDQKLNIQSLRATSLTSYNGNSLILNPIGGNVGIGTTTPSYSLDVCGSFYASTINYAKLYTSTVYVGNDNASTNMIRFYGTNMDGPGQASGPYSHTVIAERIYQAPENSELLLFKGNDNGANFNDRIRHLAAAHQFDIIAHASEWPDTSGNPPNAAISGALYVDNTGKVGVGTTSPGASLDVSGSFISRLKFVDVASGAASFTLNTTHYGAYIYLQFGFNNAITLPTGGSAPPDGTVVVIINNSGNNITITPPSAGNTSGTITSANNTNLCVSYNGPRLDRSIVEMSYYACALTAKTLSGDTLAYSNLGTGRGRGSLAAASWGNTIVFAGGRTNDSTHLNYVDIINATTLGRTTATLSVGRSYLAGASANGKIFFAGGITGSSPLVASNVVDIYDVALNTWTITTLPSGARHSLTAIGYGGKVYFAGGGTDGSSPYKVNPPSNAIDIYDTTTNLWLPSKTLGTARAQLASAAINNKILFTCGSLTTTTHTDAIDIYDVTNDTWSSFSLGNVTGNYTNAARGALGCAAVNNKIVFGGGISGTTITRRVDIYDTVTGSWTCLPAQLTIQKVGLCAVGLNNVIVFSTGSDATNSLTNKIDIYNTSTGIWTTKDNLPEGSSVPDAGKVYDLAGAAAGNIIIFGGGFYPFGPTIYTYIYTPPYYI